MADSKISTLTAATLPLAGTEVLPIVQSSTTKKVATDDLTVKNVRSNATTGLLQVTGPGAGTTRVMTVPNANFTAARTDSAQSLTGLQTVSVTGNSAVNSANTFDLLVSGGATKYGTIRMSDNATYSAFINWNNANLILTGPGATSGIDIDASGNIKPENGNVVQGTAAKGFNFTANTPAAGMTSQLLNWYEEGTWTPTLLFGGANVGMTGTFIGRYTRVGRQVYVYVSLELSAKGSSTGNATVTGAPFSSADYSTGIGDPVQAMANLTAGGAIPIGIAGTTFYLFSQTTTDRTLLTDANFTNSSILRFSLVYNV